MSDHLPAFGDLADSFAATAQTLFVGRTVDATLRRIVDFAQSTVSGCDSASITLLRNGKTFTPVSSTPIATEIDQYQYAYREGPCLDAIHCEPLQYCEDLTDDDRWPTFGPMAFALGMKSLLSCRLVSDTTLGSLNLYARAANAFGTEDRAKDPIFAKRVGVALGAADALTCALVRSQGLEIALASRSVIGQAQDIVFNANTSPPSKHSTHSCARHKRQIRNCATLPVRRRHGRGT